jgi:hypothetical protein
VHFNCLEPLHGQWVFNLVQITKTKTEHYTCDKDCNWPALFCRLCQPEVDRCPAKTKCEVQDLQPQPLFHTMVEGHNHKDPITASAIHSVKSHGSEMLFTMEWISLGIPSDTPQNMSQWLPTHWLPHPQSTERCLQGLHPPSSHTHVFACVTQSSEKSPSLGRQKQTLVVKIWQHF